MKLPPRSAAFAGLFVLSAALSSACDDILLLGPLPSRFDTTPLAPPPHAPAGGHAVYRVGDPIRGPVVERLSLSDPRLPEDVSAGLDALSLGEDLDVAATADGRFLALVTSRFGCDQEPCLAIVSSDLATARRVRTLDDRVPTAESVTLSADARTLAFVARGETRGTDVFVVTHADAIETSTPWSLPVAVSARSPFAYNASPSLSPDGATVFFDCGDMDVVDAERSICEVSSRGGDIRVRVGATDAPANATRAAATLRHPTTRNDGLLFEADWFGTTQVFLAPHDGPPRPISPDVSNDTAPCALPDGRIVSSWTGRAANRPGVRELKVMGPDGSRPRVVVRRREILGAPSCSE